MIVDSNIVIYSQSGSYPNVLHWLSQQLPAISAVTMVEVLGFHRITPQQILEYENLFNTLTIYSVDDLVIRRAISLRQSKRMSLGDAIIAATCLVHAMPLATANVSDFIGIPGLTVVNPMIP